MITISLPVLFCIALVTVLFLLLVTRWRVGKLEVKAERLDRELCRQLEELRAMRQHPAARAANPAAPYVPSITDEERAEAERLRLELMERWQRERVDLESQAREEFGVEIGMPVGNDLR